MRTSLQSAAQCILIVLSLCQVVTPAAAQCRTLEAGVPPDSSNNSGGVFLGEALGQTFHADHTLIQSISVWRVPWQAHYVYGIRVFLVPTDSVGVPDVRNMLLAGPTVFHTDGDGVNPTEFEFVFDPPFRLPKTGEYEFAVQSDPCEGIWDILGSDGRTDGRDYYTGGYAWVHSRSTDPDCHLRTRPSPSPATDLCFRVRYCDQGTPVRRNSWGSLKIIYR
jgi:hypothetical protein